MKCDYDPQVIVNREMRKIRMRLSRTLSFDGVMKRSRNNLSPNPVSFQSFDEFISSGRDDGLYVRYFSADDYPVNLIAEVEEAAQLDYLIHTEYNFDECGRPEKSGIYQRRHIWLYRTRDKPDLIQISVVRAHFLGAQFAKLLDLDPVVLLMSDSVSSDTLVYRWIFDKHPEFKYDLLQLIELATQLDEE